MPTEDDPLNMARAYWQSRVILTAAELDLFTQLHTKPMSAARLAAIVGLDLRAATRLLDCLITFGLLAKDQDVYWVTSAGEPLSSRHPETILPMVLHLNHLWGNWSGLTEAVRKGGNPARSTVTEWSGKEQKAFIGAMHVMGRRLAQELAAAYDLRPFHCLLDVGGASGSYTIAFLRRNPELHAVLFDLPEVIPLAKERLIEEGLLHRVRLTAGDFYQDELPGGCDLALLSAIIHQNSPAENLELFQKVQRALAPGGVLLIRDHIMEESRTHPPTGALFALNMLVNTRGGDTYTMSELTALLEAAGFQRIRLVRRGEKMDCLVEAQKPL